MAKRYRRDAYKCDKCNVNFEVDDSPSSQITVIIPGELGTIYDLCPECSALFVQKRNDHENFSMKY